MKTIPFYLRTKYTTFQYESYISPILSKNMYSIIFSLQFFVILLFNFILSYLSTLDNNTSFVSYILLFVVFLVTIYSLCADAQFSYDNNKFKFKSFIYSGLFSKEEMDCILIQLVKNYNLLTIPLISSLFIPLIFTFVRYINLAHISIFTLAGPTLFGFLLLLNSLRIIKKSV